jgi:hypothetical protein
MSQRFRGPSPLLRRVLVQLRKRLLALQRLGLRIFAAKETKMIHTLSGLWCLALVALFVVCELKGDLK